MTRAAPSRLWWVYVLECGDGTLYTGVTTDLARRLAQHQAGQGARYTRGRGRLRLRWFTAAAGQGRALAREAALKRLPRGRKLALPAAPGVRPATAADLPFLTRAIRALDLDGERVSHEQFVIATVGARRAGFARVKPYGRCFELGCLGVLAPFRGRGLGTMLVRLLCARFPTRRVWITTDLPAYFAPLGFRVTARPPAELATKLAGLSHRVRRTGVVAMVATRPAR
ncbi:MAG TPA: GNAT family N-acetyltransferase [Polyangia bacterium]